MKKNFIKISKFLSLALRHKPHEIGIRLDRNGWTDVAELIEKSNKKGTGLDFETLAEVVATNDKKRFSFNGDKTKIRANQGHSLRVDLELKASRPPDILYHGTASRFWHSISKKGLLRRNRQYVHLSKDIETARKVGVRHGTPLILTIESGLMFEQGIKFFLSENGVWMTDHVPVKYMKRQKTSDATDSRPMRKLKACGVFCIRERPQKQFLLLRCPHRWDIPKGHMEKNESELECALRELYEETGIREDQLSLCPDFRFEHTYYPKYKRFPGEKIEKTVVIFLGKIEMSVKIRTTEHEAFQWVGWNSAHLFSEETIHLLLGKAGKYLEI